jgi:hypothetical protein
MTQGTVRYEFMIPWGVDEGLDLWKAQMWKEVDMD